jgi:hypothetical protein
VVTLLSFQCNPSDPEKDKAKQKPVSDIRAEIKKLNLKSLTLLDSAKAVQMAQAASDSSFKRVYSIGSLDANDIKALVSVPGFKSLQLIPGATSSGKGLQQAYFLSFEYDVETTTDKTTSIETQTVILDVKALCPPPDGLLCYQNYFDGRIIK